MAPYIANPDHYVFYDTYALPVEKGENVIGLLPGNGFQNNAGGYVWDFDKASFRGAPKVALCLNFCDKNGREVVIKTDASFKTHPSPILWDDYRFGEHYDANAELIGWTGDAAVSSEYMTLNFATEKSYRQWLKCMVKAQKDSGQLPGIVPTSGWGYRWGNGPAWDSALTYIPYMVYVYRGETDMIEEAAEAFIKYLRYLESRAGNARAVCPKSV